MKEIKLKYSTGSTHSDPIMKKMFDTGYLFMDIMIDDMIEKKYLSNTFEKISEKEFQKIVYLNQILRNGIFTSIDRNNFDDLGQIKLERVFKETINDVNYEGVYKKPTEISKMLFIRKAGVYKKYKTKFTEYYNNIINKFRTEALRINYNTLFIETIIDDINAGEKLEGVLIKLYSEKANSKSLINNKLELNGKDLNGVVRELIAIENYKLIQLKGKITNMLFFKTIDLKDYFHSNCPNNKEEYFSLIIDSHYEIDNLIDSFNKDQDERLNKMKEMFKNLKLKEYKNYYKHINDDTISILHYILDYYAMNLPDNIQRKESNKIAVIIYLLFEEIKKIFFKGDYYINEIDKDFLAQFGGWKTSGNLQYLGYTTKCNFLEIFDGDANLLIPNDFKLPKNWENIWGKAGGYIEEE